MYCGYFNGCCFQELYQTTINRLVLFPWKFFKCSVRVKVVWPYSSTVTTTGWQNSHFILSERSDFHMVKDLSREVCGLSLRMLTLLSVDKILLPMYMN